MSSNRARRCAAARCPSTFHVPYPLPSTANRICNRQFVDGEFIRGIAGGVRALPLAGLGVSKKEIRYENPLATSLTVEHNHMPCCYFSPFCDYPRLFVMNHGLLHECSS